MRDVTWHVTISVTLCIVGSISGYSDTFRCDAVGLATKPSLYCLNTTAPSESEKVQSPRSVSCSLTYLSPRSPVVRVLLVSLFWKRPAVPRPAAVAAGAACTGLDGAGRRRSGTAVGHRTAAAAAGSAAD